MSTKNSILQILENNRETDISGEQLAQTLDISRAAVHKAVNDLRRDGYSIDAVTNKGYRLSRNNDIISSEGIKSFLNIEIGDIYVHKVISSTNQTAKQLALDGAKHGSVVIANEQTSGRGRMGRNFYSPPDCGIYMSVILRPNFSAQEGMLITTLASVAVCRAIESFGVSPRIKWVNDIIINGKKVCGISTEAVTDLESGNIEFLILGIGINVSTDSFPDGLQNIAVSLQIGRENTRNRLIAEVLKHLFSGLDNIGADSIITEYKKRSIVLGHEIDVIHQGEVTRAKAVDIDNKGGLVITLSDGTTQTLVSGEISIRGDFYNG